MYPIELTTPMSKDLTDYGFESLKTPDQVSETLENAEGTTLVVVNSVCGCAAANARPGAKLAIHQAATAKAREYMLPYPPSSPSIALFKDGRLVHFLERMHIEGRSAEIIAENLKMAFDRYC
mgnify:CR=1 FL=1